MMVRMGVSLLCKIISRPHSPRSCKRYTQYWWPWRRYKFCPSSLQALPLSFQYLTLSFPHTMTSPLLKHVVFLPGPSWGHLRPGMKTALRMVEKFPNLFMSLFVYHTEVSKANQYLGGQPTKYSKRIRVVTASTEEAGPSLSADNMIGLLSHMEVCFKLWIASELQQPSAIQVEGHYLGAPSLVIEDLFNGGMSLECKDVHNIPVAGWWITPASSLMTITGHEETNNETAYDSLAQLDSQGEEDFFTKANKLYLQNVSDRLVSIPGLPAVYEWELMPQYIPFIPPFMTYLVPRVSNFLRHVEALVCCTTLEMEPICTTSLSTAFKHPIKPFFIGPAVDLSTPHQSDPNSPVTQFLDRAYAEKGARSVVYVAFGTGFFPLPESMSHLIAAVDEVTKAGFRFIFALSSANAKVDQLWMNAHVEAGNAIFPEWTNQTGVLEHPAIHYFLSHGGWNSSTEALVRGVPMIFWPFTGDQPTNAIQIAAVHDCGFELLQVRTGPAKSKAYRNGTEVRIIGTDDAVREEMKRIMELSKGPRGAHQRVNSRMLGRVIAGSLTQEGSGEVGLAEFGNALGLVR
ncbi:unnamed protein product [Rhizoctonia solani]|uniref:UDP-glycosyltransferase 74C1 n=1 Tax=Rhizoctonia solani TaxID=456999 RepID=A0A8H3AA61_9AGAM|nr:unnamed protein product [Rhizoctonia solani]